MTIHAQKLIQAAQQLGITVTDLSSTWHMDAWRLEYEGQSHLVCNEGLLLPSLTHQAFLIARNKFASKAMMRELGFPVPAGMVITNPNHAKASIERFIAEYGTAVFKPLDACNGDGVLMNVTNLAMMLEHWQQFGEDYGDFLLEQQVSGKDLRMFVIGGQPIAACRRVPARIIGNGIATARELIDLERERSRRTDPSTGIDVDEKVLQRLADHGLTMDDRVPAGQTIQLKTVANMAQGAVAIDVTDEIHPGYAQWTQRLAKTLNLDVFSLDVITSDHTATPETHAFALELNGESAWMNHTTSEGRQHPLPEIILRHLFKIPEQVQVPEEQAVLSA